MATAGEPLSQTSSPFRFAMETEHDDGLSGFVDVRTRLFGIAFRMLGSASEAEDIVQETYLSAWKSFSRFEPGTDCRAWLFTIMFNAIRQYRRKWFHGKACRDADEVLRRRRRIDREHRTEYVVRPVGREALEP